VDIKDLKIQLQVTIELNVPLIIKEDIYVINEKAKIFEFFVSNTSCITEYYLKDIKTPMFSLKIKNDDFSETFLKVEEEIKSNKSKELLPPFFHRKMNTTLTFLSDIDPENWKKIPEEGKPNYVNENIDKCFELSNRFIIAYRTVTVDTFARNVSSEFCKLFGIVFLNDRIQFAAARSPNVEQRKIEWDHLKTKNLKQLLSLQEELDDPFIKSMIDAKILEKEQSFSSAFINLFTAAEISLSDFYRKRLTSKNVNKEWIEFISNQRFKELLNEKRFCGLLNEEEIKFLGVESLKEARELFNVRNNIVHQGKKITKENYIEYSKAVYALIEFLRR